MIGTAFLIYSMTTTDNYKSLRLEAIEKTVAYEIERVNKIIAEVEDAAIFFAITGALCFKYQSLYLAEDLIIDYLNRFPVLTGGGFCFEPYIFSYGRLRSGFYAFRDKTTGMIRMEDSFFMEEYDYHNKSWYMELIANNVTDPHQVAWTRPYVDDSGSFSLMVTAGAGIYNNEELIGISTADWEIEEVIKQLIEIKPTENSFVKLSVRNIENPAKNYTISSTLNFRNINYMLFEKYMDNGWLLSVHIPENEIFAAIEKQNERLTIRIAFISIVMLSTVWLLISRLINLPIKRLADDVSSIALGNLDNQINISSKDEIGLLAKVFNKMTSDLKNNIEEKTKEHAEKERISAELNVAAALQYSLLPGVFPAFPEKNEFDIYALMDAAKEVCGDFYDFFFIDDNNLVVLIADVSGKGVPAALFMVIARTLIKNSSSCKSPAQVLDSVNKKLCEGNDTGMFVTVFIGFYNLPTGKFTYVNAGHNPPLIKTNGEYFRFFKTEPCYFLGFKDDIKYREEIIFLEKGDALYLYTDGVTDSMNKEKEFFGEQRLLQTVNKCTFKSVKELLTNVKHEVDNFAQGEEQSDDITMLALHITAKPKITNKNEIQIGASISNLDAVIEFVSTALENTGCLPETMNEICIAVEEVFINIANYAYGIDNGDVTISIYSTNKTIIKFEDSGHHYNPLEHPEPDLDKSIADRQIGGLGVFIVKKLMDSVKYSRIDDKNILVITKSHSN
ncbi:MAG: SpoIIE family protein phosphatase [Treponema sp.]|nr:SpoIIE family protein phosphatase [Treponema sp.]